MRYRKKVKEAMVLLKSKKYWNRKEKKVSLKRIQRYMRELAIKAIKNACLNVKNTKGILLHSNLGVQYTSLVFETYLEEKGIPHSFSGKGTPYDSACMVYFHSILKKEVNQKEYYDFTTTKRIHNAINYLTPQAAHDTA